VSTDAIIGPADVVEAVRSCANAVLALASAAAIVRSVELRDMTRPLEGISDVLMVVRTDALNV